MPKAEEVWYAAPEWWDKIKPLARQKRHDPTPAEDCLWQQLRNRQLLGCKFRRQHAIERFIVDFYSAEAGLIIEVDGGIHEYTQEEDMLRQEFLESQGFKVIRFSNERVIETPDTVLSEIAAVLQARL